MTEKITLAEKATAAGIVFLLLTGGFVAGWFAHKLFTPQNYENQTYKCPLSICAALCNMSQSCDQLIVHDDCNNASMMCVPKPPEVLCDEMCPEENFYSYYSGECVCITNRTKIGEGSGIIYPVR